MNSGLNCYDKKDQARKHDESGPAGNWTS